MTVPLFARSYYSLLQGCLSPVDLCRRAALAGYGAVGLVDQRAWLGLPRFAEDAAACGITPLAGVWLSDWGVTLLCLDYNGFRRINRILSNLGMGAESRYDPLTDLAENGWEGVRVLSPEPSVLRSLSGTGLDGLYAHLRYGRPYAALSRLANELAIGAFATTETVWAAHGDRRLLNVLASVERGKSVRGCVGHEYSLPSPSDFERYFHSCPQALAAARTFSCEADARRYLGKRVYFPRFKGLAEAEAHAALEARCRAGIWRRYGPVNERIASRLAYELGVIRRKGFAGYFLVVEDIVRQCPRTCGRGSAAASLVAYLLGITHVDPLAHDLYFDRFLNDGRTTPPDIDVDFPWDERHRILRYVFSSYPGAAAIVSDHITFGTKSSIREAARALGYSRKEVDRFCELNYAGRREQIPEEVVSTAGALQGIPRHLGTHPGGVVITPCAVSTLGPVRLSPLDMPVIGWDKEGAEYAGLVKIDLLGNRSISVLRDTLNEINSFRTKPVELESFCPVDEPATREMIEQGDTLGVFYIESPASRQLLKRMGRGDFAHLVVATSIIRPAASRYLKEYLRRLRGGVWQPIHPSLAETLNDTLGVMVFQEDVARVAIALCGMTPAQADGLRKLLCRRDRRLSMPAARRFFISAGRRRGIDVPRLEEAWDMILSFQGYSFCKAHSASYSLLAYRLAWLKHYYPLRFMAAVINNGGGYYERQVYVNAVKRMGHKVLPVSVNKSWVEYRVENGGLRVGLGQLRGVQRSVVEDIVTRRLRGGPYADMPGFLRRVRPDNASLRVLIRAGACDSISGGASRPSLLWYASVTARAGELFEAPQPDTSIAGYTDGRRLYDERQTHGLFLSSNPSELYLRRGARAAGRLGLPPCSGSREFQSRRGRRVSVVCSLAAGKEACTANGEYMCFLSLEDRHDVFEAVAFPKVYRNIADVLWRDVVYLAVGKVYIEDGQPQLRLEQLLSLRS